MSKLEMHADGVRLTKEQTDDKWLNDMIDKVAEVNEANKGLDGGGKRFNSDKPKVELLVPEAMEAEARVWALGLEKYGAFNWTRGMKWTTVLGCLLRHVFAIMRGEDIDRESGELHAAHIKCNASMLIYYYYHYKQGDDRIKRPEAKELK